MAYLHEGYRQGIAHGKCRRGTARRSKVERTRLLLHLHGDVMVGIFRQEGVGIARDGDDRDVHVKHHRDETE